MNATTDIATVPIPDNQLTVTAETPAEMAEANQFLVKWFVNKVAEVEIEAKELKEAHELAVKNKWRTVTLKRHAGLAEKRLTYYRKVLAALMEGYCIVPSFPISLFCVRTDSKKPKRTYMVSHSHWKPGYIHPEFGEALPIGEGEYKPHGPQVVENQIQRLEDGKMATRWESWAESWGDIEFPINMAKPQIMEATNRAMGLRIFDEFGVLPDPSPKKDPMIIGRIKRPGDPFSDGRNGICFIIAWHLDVRTI